MVWKIESSEISFTSLEVVERRIQEKETVTSENQAVSAFAFYSVRSHRALLPLYSIQEKQIVKSYPSEKKEDWFSHFIESSCLWDNSVTTSTFL